MLTLNPRIDFGGQAWPSPVSEFSLEWLKSNFYPAQRTRHDRVIAAIASGEAQIDKARKQAVGGVPQFGDRRANGTIHMTGADQQMQQAAEKVAHHQVVNAIRKIRETVDAECLDTLKAMERAAITAKTLSERVFTKIACLSRASAGMKEADLMALKANYATFIKGVAPIELHRLAQAAIDAGDPVSLVYLECIRVENFNRKKDDRPFLNASLIDIINVPEFNAAMGDDARPGLLRQVIDLHRDAGIAWASFLGKIGQASINRIARGLSAVKLAKDGLPAAGDDDAV